MEKNVLSSTFMISKDHPALPGHFPKHPVVPGVVLLEQVEQQLQEALQAYEITELNQAKFTHLVLPEQPIVLVIDILPRADNLTIKAKWRLTLEQGIVCATGQFMLARKNEEGSQ